MRLRSCCLSADSGWNFLLACGCPPALAQRSMVSRARGREGEGTEGQENEKKKGKNHEEVTLERGARTHAAFWHGLLAWHLPRNNIIACSLISPMALENRLLSMYYSAVRLYLQVCVVVRVVGFGTKGEKGRRRRRENSGASRCRRQYVSVRTCVYFRLCTYARGSEQRERERERERERNYMRQCQCTLC